MQVSYELKSARAQVIVDVIDNNGGVLNLLDSSNVALASMPFASPSCALSVTNGVITFASLPEALVLLTGEINSAKAFNSNGDFLFSVSVSDESGSGELKFSRLQLFAGDSIKISNWTNSEL